MDTVVSKIVRNRLFGYILYVKVDAQCGFIQFETA